MTQARNGGVAYPGDGGALATQWGTMHHRWTKAGPVESHLPDQRVDELQEVAEASIGDPAAMALFGFAVGTLLVAIPFTTFLPMSTVTGAIPTLLIFAGLAQFIGGLLTYRKGNTFAATAFCCFGANNVVVSAFFLFAGAGALTKGTGEMTLLGINLICFGYIALMLWLASPRFNAAYFLVLGALWPGYALTGIYNVGAPTIIGQIGGWFLIVSAGFAFYAAGALVLNSVYSRTVLPMIPLWSPARVENTQTERVG